MQQDLEKRIQVLEERERFEAECNAEFKKQQAAAWARQDHRARGGMTTMQCDPTREQVRWNVAQRYGGRFQ